jgi:Flp pilus assembly protein TadG
MARRVPRLARGPDAGMVTVEAAIALCSFVVVLGIALAAIVAVTDQLRCTDAAREAARLAARGEPDEGRAAAQRIAPSGAQVSIRSDGDTVAVEVSARPAGGLLPGVSVAGQAFAVAEPGAPDAGAPDGGPP